MVINCTQREFTGERSNQGDVIWVLFSPIQLTEQQSDPDDQLHNSFHRVRLLSDIVIFHDEPLYVYSLISEFLFHLCLCYNV